MVDELIAAKGLKVVIRAKTVEDAEDDHCWRQDPGLAELDAAIVALEATRAALSPAAAPRARRPPPPARAWVQPKCAQARETGFGL